MDTSCMGLKLYCNILELAHETGTTRFPGVNLHKKTAEIMTTAKFDDILMGILQHCEQVEPFLDAIFSFLARRTDFFQVMHDRSDKMGFPPGVAEKIVLKVDLQLSLHSCTCKVRQWDQQC